MPSANVHDYEALDLSAAGGLDDAIMDAVDALRGIRDRIGAKVSLFQLSDLLIAEGFDEESADAVVVRLSPYVSKNNEIDLGQFDKLQVRSVFRALLEDLHHNAEAAKP